MTTAEFNAYQARHQLRSEGDQELNRNSCSTERNLHDQIIEHCNKQWPRWCFIHARMDQKSTIQVGCQDFTIFLPGGRLLLIECKRVGGKLSLEQQGWAAEMRRLNHVVHVVETFSEFLNLITYENPAKDHPRPD